MSSRNEKDKQKSSISSPSQTLTDNFLTRPLTDAPSRGAKRAANVIDMPRKGSTSFDPNTTLGKVENTANIINAMVRGGLAGMTEGVGNVATDMTSPISIMGALMGGAGAKSGVNAASKVSKITRPTIDVIENIPVKQVAPAADDVASLIGDMQRNLAKVPTSKSITAPTVAPKPMSPALPAEMVAPGAEAAYNATRAAAPAKSSMDSILDMMANRRKYQQQFGTR